MWKMHGNINERRAPVNEPVKPISKSKCGTQTAVKKVENRNILRAINILKSKINLRRRIIKLVIESWLLIGWTLQLISARANVWKPSKTYLKCKTSVWFIGEPRLAITKAWEQTKKLVLIWCWSSHILPLFHCFQSRKIWQWKTQ